MKNRLFLVLVVLSLGGCAKKAPSDDVRIGKLPNGFSYYIKHNEFPKEKASLQLIVKVGSLHETEEERGVAHFLEHMMFRGSEHFADFEIIQYLESIGAQFGADTNAFTTFEETCYHLNIPLEKEGALEKGVLILSDYAGRASLKGELIEKERTVIMDEYNAAERSSQGRISHQMYDKFFKDSSYADRFPIGNEEVILHCSPEVIKKFYEKWYHPSRMALIAVGDFDVAVMEREIQKCFGDLKNGNNKETVSTEVCFLKKPTTLFITDKEEMFIQGGFTEFYPKEFAPKVEKNSIRADIIASLFSSILNQRLDALTKASQAPFLYAAMVSLPFTTYHDATRFHFVGFMDRPIDGAKALYREVERLRTLGPTKGELERELSCMEEGLNSTLANLNKIENESFAQLYVDHFIHKRAFISPKEGCELRKTLLKKIRTKDLIQFAKKNIHLDKMHKIFSMPHELVLSSNDLEEGIIQVKSEKLLPYKEVAEPKLTVISEGVENIKSAVFNEKLGSTTLILENGIEVILHPTTLEKGRVSIELVAAGGKTLFLPEEFASLELSPRYLIESGLSNLNGVELQNFLQKRDSTLSLWIGANLRLISTSGPKEQKEMLLQTIRSIFMERRFDSAIWSGLLEQWKEIENQRDNQPQSFFIERAVQILYDKHPFYTFTKSSDAKEALSKRCIEHAFQDPRDFSLIIVGDFDVKEMKALVCKYLYFPKIEASKMREIQLPSLPIVEESFDKTIYRGSETHGLTLMCYRKNCEGRELSHLSLKALTHILTQRMLEKLRKESGDTYDSFITYECPLEPIMHNVHLCAYFTSKPEKGDELKGQITQVIDQFVKEGPTEEEVSSAREIIKQQVKEGREKNAFWSNLHKQSLLHKKPIETLLSEKESLDIINQKELHELSVALFKETLVIKLSLAPESP